VKRLAPLLKSWGQRVGLARKLAVALTLAAIGSGVATYTLLTSESPLGGPSPRTVFALLAVDIVLLLLLAGLVAWRLFGVWVERRSGAAGSKLHVRLVVMFSLVAVTPAIVVALFSAALIHFGVEQWFNQRVTTALDESMAVANAYLEEHQQIIGGDALAMANDINREGASLLHSPNRLSKMVGTQAAVRGLSEAVVFDDSGQVLARAGLEFSMELSIDRIPQWAFDRVHSGEVTVLTNPGDERVRALVELEGGLTPTYLYVGRFVDPKVLDHLERTSRAVAEYKELEGSRFSLEVTFSAIFVVVALLLLLAAVWVGLTLATRLARPIAELIDAAERVRTGDLSARVDEEAASDELGSLSRAFNRMTMQLDTQRRELVGANLELDERRRFTETVLAGVSAGVIGLDRLACIELPNRTAAEFLASEPEALVGRPLSDVVPEFRDLLESVRRRPERPVQHEMKLTRGGRTRVLLVRIVAEQGEIDVTGYVVTLDDITELLSAQRTAAWADVARRIAHEIKNPLTPIQLSAERLRRKYLKHIESDRETFITCTDTIVRHVGDIGRMVDEFSAFARMPAPMMKPEDVLEVVRQTVFLLRNGYPDVAFETELPEGKLKMPCDARQVAQALTNLLKNAVEAIQGREGKNLPKGRVVVRAARQGGNVVVSVEDNGKGLPLEERDILTEPYVTTRMKGTGLGLAIVKKIMEDHGGALILEDLEGTGARVSLVFDARNDILQSDVTHRMSNHGA
jgi:two-component system nitrogen regulation sensor histidine kinase NtrY